MEALAQTVTITLPDGSTRTVPAGTTLRAIAEGIGPRLAKDALAGKIDGKVVDLAAPVAAGREGRDRDAEVSRRARALPPLDGPPDGQRGQAPLPDGPDRHRAGDRERLLLRLQPGAALHAGGPRGDRGRDEEDRRRGQPGRAARDVQGRGHPDLRGSERQAQGRDHPRHPGRPRLLLPPEGLHRPLPRAARALHGQARRLQADAHGGRLLEGRREEPDAPADLRRLLRFAEGARRAPEAARGGAGARPPQARQGARSLLVPPARAGVALLSPEGRDPLQRPARPSCATSTAAAATTRS